MNKYFDLLLIHGDPNFYALEETFTRLKDIKCQINYTGFVVQEPPNHSSSSTEISTEIGTEEQPLITSAQPLILVSVGGGRFGHELIDAIVEIAPLLAENIPHQIQVFTGPFIPEEKLINWQNITYNQKNITINRYTPHILTYMQKADLSISMSGYNTTLNIMTTGVKAMILPFTGNDDQEQKMRAKKLDELGIVKMLEPEDLIVEVFAEKIINYLQVNNNTIIFDFNGVKKTQMHLINLLSQLTAA